MARRRKSLKDIYEQADRILDEVARRGWNGREYSAETHRRLDRLSGILDRYAANGSKYFGKTEGNTTNAEYNTPLPRRVYMGLAAG